MRQTQSGEEDRRSRFAASFAAVRRAQKIVAAVVLLIKRRSIRLVRHLDMTRFSGTFLYNTNGCAQMEGDGQGGRRNVGFSSAAKCRE